jgi:AcrR family transcriptional regulator
MREQKERKTDRRTIYTQNAVKDALLRLERKTAYSQINVTALCRVADISRATFYQHFDSIDDVLDCVIDDALLFSEGESGSVIDVLDAIQSGKEHLLRERESILPACQRIADSNRYHHLFMDDSISGHIIHRIYLHEHDKVVPSLMERSAITRKEAEMVFRYILFGSFSVNRALGWEKNADWYDVQKLLSRFINAGMNALKSFKG